MKTVTHETSEVIKKTRTEYVADDGTVFECSLDCLEYENNLARDRVVATISRINALDYELPLGFQVEGWHWSAYWFTPQNIEEALAIKDAFELPATSDDIAKWALRGVTVVVDDLNRVDYVSFDDSVRCATKVLEQLGYRVEHEQLMGFEASRNKEYGKRLCVAMREICASPVKMDRFECYVSRHLSEWVRKYASLPSGLVSELELFADIESEED